MINRIYLDLFALVLALQSQEVVCRRVNLYRAESRPNGAQVARSSLSSHPEMEIRIQKPLSSPHARMTAKPRATIFMGAPTTLWSRFGCAAAMWIKIRPVTLIIFGAQIYLSI